MIDHQFKPYADNADLCVAELYSGETCNQERSAHGGKFSIDGEGLFDAVSFGPDWNGWATPVVTRDTLVAVTQDSVDEGYLTLDFGVDGTAFVTEIHPGGLHGDDVEITPDANGNYDLGLLGWVFTEEGE